MAEFSHETIIDANALRNSNVQKRHIKEILADILRKINDEIKDAHQEGRHSIVTDIPIVYTIPNMSNSDAQRIVWAKLIEILKAKNYRVWINPSVQQCSLKITWLSETEENEIKYQINLLADHTINRT